MEEGGVARARARIGSGSCLGKQSECRAWRAVKDDYLCLTLECLALVFCRVFGEPGCHRVKHSPARTPQLSPEQMTHTAVLANIPSR